MKIPFINTMKNQKPEDTQTMNETPEQTVLSELEALKVAKGEVSSEYETWLAAKAKRDDIDGKAEKAKTEAVGLKSEMDSLIRSDEGDIENRVRTLSGRHAAAMSLAEQYRNFSAEFSADVEAADIAVNEALRKYYGAFGIAIKAYSIAERDNAFGAIDDHLLQAIKLRALALSSNPLSPPQFRSYSETEAIEVALNEVRSHLAKQIQTVQLNAEENPDIALLLGGPGIPIGNFKDFKNPAALSARRKALADNSLKAA